MSGPGAGGKLGDVEAIEQHVPAAEMERMMKIRIRATKTGMAAADS
jgi:hypothetical protein